MSETLSEMLALGTPTPNFNLPDTNGKAVSLKDFSDSPALLVVFMCNHCPFVKHILGSLVEFVKHYQPKGLAVVGINSNDLVMYPQDSPEQMVKLAKEADFSFPYLYDENQQTAKDFHAACTPDFFLFDTNRKLVYRGQFDDSRPGNGINVTGEDLAAAVDAVLEGKPVSQKQKPSMGCNIKWKQGNNPDYLE